MMRRFLLLSTAFIMRFPLVFVLIAALLLLLGGCAGTDEVSPPSRSGIVASLGVPIGGCCAGDLDPELPGHEIALAASDGRVVVLSRRGDGFHEELVATLPGEMIQCLAFDLDPWIPGDELYLVGAARGGEDDGLGGAAWQIARRNGSWQAKRILEDAELLHAVCGENPSGPEARLFIAGYGGRLHRFAPPVAGPPAGVMVATFEGRAKGACAALGGIALACADGGLRLWKPGASPEITVLGRFPSALSRVCGNEARVVFCANDGSLRQIDREGQRELLFRAQDRLRGARMGDFDPAVPGLEYATAGYDGSIYLLRRNADLIRSEVLARDHDRFHHLAEGELAGMGKVLVACGYSGRVTVVRLAPEVGAR